jgi:hypothetical protein
MDKLRALLFLVIAMIAGYVASNFIQERMGYIHASVDWLGGMLASCIGIAVDIGYRWRWGHHDGWRRYLGEGGGVILSVPFWCFGLVGLVASIAVFVRAGATW